MPSTNKGIAKAKKEERKEQAQIRNDAWEAMTPKEQLMDLDARGVKAEKQRAKIKARMKNEGK